MRTRSQQYSQQVFKQLEQLDFEEEAKKQASEKTKSKVPTEADINLKKAELEKQYGSLCHKFPLMVLRSGLAQATAFVWVKSKNNENSPSGVFLRDLSRLTNGSEGESASAFQQRINALDLAQYQRTTRQILAASLWYKRFAESLLGVAGDTNDG